jgi:hypothetical protein
MKKPTPIQADEYMAIPLYYAVVGCKIVYDEDSIREFFEMRLKELVGG